MVWIKGHTFSTIRPMIVGATMNQPQFLKFKGGFRTIFFLPMVCAPAAVTMVWRWIFNGDYGILNQLFGATMNQPQFCSIRAARESLLFIMEYPPLASVSL